MALVSLSRSLFGSRAGNALQRLSLAERDFLANGMVSHPEATWIVREKITTIQKILDMIASGDVAKAWIWVRPLRTHLRHAFDDVLYGGIPPRVFEEAVALIQTIRQSRELPYLWLKAMIDLSPTVVECLVSNEGQRKIRRRVVELVDLIMLLGEDGPINELEQLKVELDLWIVHSQYSRLVPPSYIRLAEYVEKYYRFASAYVNAIRIAPDLGRVADEILSRFNSRDYLVVVLGRDCQPLYDILESRAPGATVYAEITRRVIENTSQLAMIANTLLSMAANRKVVIIDSGFEGTIPTALKRTGVRLQAYLLSSVGYYPTIGSLSDSDVGDLEDLPKEAYRAIRLSESLAVVEREHRETDSGYVSPLHNRAIRLAILKTAK